MEKMEKPAKPLTAVVVRMHKEKNNTNTIYIIGVLFFIFGFVTWLNGTLIPFLKIACQLQTYLQAFLVTFCFYMAYFILAIPSSLILRRIGYKNGMALGLLVMAVGCLLFLPAASTRAFSLFLTGLFVQASGLALLQTAANPYISIVGPLESAAQRISIMGICSKVAGALSPLILGALVLKGASSLQISIDHAVSQEQKKLLLQQLAGRVRGPYLLLTLILSLLALLVKKSSLPEVQADKELPRHQARSSVLQYPYLLLGVLCLFLYVGVEVMAGDAIGIYGMSLGITIDKARYFTTFTLVAMLVGYLIGVITIPRYISQATSLKLSALLGIIFTICIFLTRGYTAITFIALLGLANALMWPAIFPLAIYRLGRFTNTGSALLIMGIAGGAVMPLLYGYLKEKQSIGNSFAFFLCLFPSYLFILYYATYGHKVGRQKINH